MIIAVTGWRGYTDAAFIRNQLMIYNSLRACSMHGPLHVRVGDALGADAITLRWCLENKVSHHVFYADWGNSQLRAGPQRNRRMLRGDGDRVAGRTGLLMAFPRPGGPAIRVPGSGTWGCCIEAYQQGIRVEIPAYRNSGE